MNTTKFPETSYNHDKSIMKLFDKVKKDLNILSIWLRSNKLLLNQAALATMNLEEDRKMKTSIKPY